MTTFQPDFEGDTVFADGTPIPAEPAEPMDPAFCDHANVDTMETDRSVGFEGYSVCEDCGLDMTTLPRDEEF